MATTQPVTVEGWYELQDGRVQFYYWNAGQLKSGDIVASWADVPGDADDAGYCDVPDDADDDAGYYEHE